VKGFGTIETERLFLRTLNLTDKDAFFKYRSMPEVYKYQAWCPKNTAEIEAFIIKNLAVHLNEKDTWLQLAVCLKGGPLIGDIGVHCLVDEQQVEIGYTLSPEYQGKGYAAEAVRAVIAYLFSELEKHRVSASVDPDNSRSVKLLEKLGFRKEAHFVRSFFMEGRWYDDCVYAILEDEPLPELRND